MDWQHPPHVFRYLAVLSNSKLCFAFREEAVRVFPPAARTLRGDRRSDRPETGSIRAKARWEVQITAREFPEAAALGSQLQGILTATLKVGRQSIARRIPVGVIGIITPWNS